MTTTRQAVEAFVKAAVPDPDHVAAFGVAAAAAMRLADVLDTAESGSGAANASRELRHQLEVARLLLADPGPSVPDLRERQQDRSKQREFDAITAMLNQAMLDAEAERHGSEQDDDDPPSPPPTFSF
jgi:hypothetical protein